MTRPRERRRVGTPAWRRTSPSRLSYRGDFACAFHALGPVGEGSFIGLHACDTAHAAIGRSSCIGEQACERIGGRPAETTIGNNACRGERACFNNPGPIEKGTCNGPLVSGKGGEIE